jgi:hypothetical protein
MHGKAFSFVTRCGKSIEHQQKFMLREVKASHLCTVGNSIQLILNSRGTENHFVPLCSPCFCGSKNFL